MLKRSLCIHGLQKAASFLKYVKSHKNKIMHVHPLKASKLISGNVTSGDDLTYLMFYNSENWKLSV